MASGKACAVCNIVSVVVAIGAINWGLSGVFGLDLVARVLGEMSTASRVVYGVIGVAGIMKVLALAKCCPCSKTSCEVKT